MKHDFFKEYKNIRIRPIEILDIELLRMWRNDKKNTQYLSQIPFITSEMQLNWYKNMEIKENEYAFAIDETKILERCVGSFSLYNFSERKCEFGKILIGDEEAHGKKVAANSIVAALLVCFEKFELDKVFLHVYKENFIAIKVYEQVGFIKQDEYNTELGKELVMEITKEQFYNKGDYNE